MEASDGESASTAFNHNEEGSSKWGYRSKRQVKKKITLVYLLKVICASQETCLDWLKNRGLIPKIMFCPNCSRKMKFEACEHTIDGYIWVCKCYTDFENKTKCTGFSFVSNWCSISKQVLEFVCWFVECRLNTPQFSARHGSWLENKDASLVDILLFTYLWSHGFSEAQIIKETNMAPETVKAWTEVYVEICDALHRKSAPADDDCGDENILEINNKEPPAIIWRRKNKHKDPFLEFLKDADSL